MRQIDSGLIAQVCALARDAGEAILAVYDDSEGDAVKVSLKADESPLTLADLASHRVISEGLQRLTPEIPVVSEEDAASQGLRVEARAFWLIDPLDGTKEFIARNGEFTVNIALIRDGKPVWGVVGAPVLGVLYAGGAGLGAWREQAGVRTALRVAAPPVPGATCRVVASKSHLNEETRAFIDQLGVVALVQAGSSLKFCKIADGEADVYPRLAPTCEWDTAAAQAVLEGAGGHVQDMAGQPLRYGKPEILNPGFVAASLPLSSLVRQ